MVQTVSRLRDDEAHVWYRLTEPIQDDELKDLETGLSPDERDRCARFAFAHDRRDYTAAHALVRRTLSRYGERLPLDWRFESAPHGKPLLAPELSSGLAFNLSHTRGLVACAVTHGADIGVDVESIDESRSRREIAERYFSVAENRCLAACPAHDYPRRFAEVWTLKEAYIKALGTGLSHPLDSFSFQVNGACVRFEGSSEIVPVHWQFALTYPAPGFCLAVAVRGGPRIGGFEITVHDADAASGPHTPVRASGP